MAGVLGAEAVTELDKIRCIAKALGDARRSAHASFSPGEGTIALSQESAEDTAAVLRDVGAELAAAAEGLATAVEAQLAEFFNYMREKEASAVVAVLRTRSVVPDGFKLVLQEDFQAACATASSCSCEAPQTSAGNLPQNITSPTSQRPQLRAAASSLQTCLFLMLEALLARVRATRAAVYLEDSPENPHVLCRVAQICAEDTLPLEVSCTSNNMLVTAVRGGMAINFDNGGTPPDNDGSKSPHRVEEKVRRLLRVRSGIIVPIGNYGCALVAEKAAGEPQLFTPFDEYQVWALASLCEGIFPRYAREAFVKMPWRPAVGELRQCTCLPPLPRPRRCGDPPRPVAAASAAPSLETLPSVPKRLTVLRASGNKVSIIEDPAGLPRVHLTFEGLFQEAAEYVRNIEELWHKAVDEVNQLKICLDEQVHSLDAKTHQIIGLEGEVRRLNGHLLSLRGTVTSSKRGNVT
ncbi:uncharacterized protein Tco025E_03899 [Trypanosoma conorhini]|uniref:Uncharacterized protein n=1 Tax=Trypanosoma conorhini TaxID=83891 RepID=A0A422PRQ9_9TRYP|nr:uncharacterized protein Tco025E_03899 [Trypanosoma conorhini]RNF20197.1 hypothetical protein Tco025E_03899 [Trypanosoma conorhini]